MLLFFCEREWMKNRCKATVRTAQQQRRRCALCLTLHYTMQRFAIYLKTVQHRGYPPLSKNYGVFFLCRESWILSGLHRAARCA